MVPAKRPLLRRPWFWVTTGVLVIVIAVAAGVAAWRTHQEHQQHVITYSVTGAGGASDVLVFYTTAQGRGAVENVNLPWSKTVIVSGSLKGFGVSAGTDPNGGYVTCTISEDGTVINQETAHGNNLLPGGQANCNLPGS
jgi:hypothetical protein